MPSRAHRSASQVPGEDALGGHDEIVTRGRHDLEQSVQAGLHMPMRHNLTVLIEDADAHGTGMQVDPTVQLVLWGVEPPEVSSSFASGCSQRQHTTAVC
jgi:hypothetical protein